MDPTPGAPEPQRTPPGHRWARRFRAPVQVLRRFPLPSAAALLGLAVLLATFPDGPVLESVPPITLGIPLFLALRLAGERGLLSRSVEGAASIVVAALLLVMYLTWLGWSDDLRVLRFGQIFVAAHLLVAVLPFAWRRGRGPTPDGPELFRPFNRHLLLRTVEGALQAAVLMAGISVALVAVDRLLGLTVPGETYARLAAILLLGFLPAQVLSGITFEPDTDNPRALQVLGRFILVPLASLYLLILTIYLGQVLLTRSWPSGWIGWLVACMAVVGILSILLVRPSTPEDDRWAWRWERLFWILMIPAAAMFLSALARRVGQYGVTEPRYLGVVLGGWLLVMAVGFGLTRLRDLRILPATLAVVLLIPAGGPWGMAAVSEASQVERLRTLLASEDAEVTSMPAAPPLVRGEAEFLPFDEPEPPRTTEIRAVLSYLFRTHPEVDLSQELGAAWDAEVPLGPGRVARASSVPDRGERYRSGERVDAAMRAMGLGLGWGMNGGARGERWALLARVDAGGALPVTGFDRLYAVQLHAGPPDANAGPLTRIEGVEMRVRQGTGAPSRVELVVPGGEGDAGDRVVARFDLASMIPRLAEWLPRGMFGAMPGGMSGSTPASPPDLRRVEVPSEALTFEGEILLPDELPAGLRLRLVVDQLHLRWRAVEPGVSGESVEGRESAEPLWALSVAGPAWLLVRDGDG